MTAVHLLAACWLLGFVGLAAGQAPALAARMAQPQMVAVCGSNSWTLVGPGWRIGSANQFASSGGRLFPAAVRDARHLPHVQYWVLTTTHIVNTCRGWRLTSIEIGVDRRHGSYLFAVNAIPFPPGGLTSPPGLAEPPPAPCLAVRATKYTGQILRPRQFRGAIVGYPRLQPDLSAVTATSAIQIVRKNVYMTVFAGASSMKGFGRRGAIEVIMSGTCQLGPVSVDTTDRQTGPLTLTGIRGDTVFFTYAGGRGTLNLHTHRFGLRVRR